MRVAMNVSNVKPGGNFRSQVLNNQYCSVSAKVTRGNNVENPIPCCMKGVGNASPKQNKIEITVAEEPSKQEEKHEEILERQATEEERAPRPVRTT